MEIPSGEPAGVSPLRPVLNRRFALGRSHLTVCALFGDVAGVLQYSGPVVHRSLEPRRIRPLDHRSSRLADVRAVSPAGAGCARDQLLLAFSSDSRAGGTRRRRGGIVEPVRGGDGRTVRGIGIGVLRPDAAHQAWRGRHGPTLLLSWVRNPILRPEVFAVFWPGVARAGGRPRSGRASR